MLNMFRKYLGKRILKVHHQWSVQLQITWFVVLQSDCKKKGAGGRGEHAPPAPPLKSVSADDGCKKEYNIIMPTTEPKLLTTLSCNWLRYLNEKINRQKHDDRRFQYKLVLIQHHKEIKNIREIVSNIKAFISQ